MHGLWSNFGAFAALAISAGSQRSKMAQHKVNTGCDYIHKYDVRRRQRATRTLWAPNPDQIRLGEVSLHAARCALERQPDLLKLYRPIISSTINLDVRCDADDTINPDSISILWEGARRCNARAFGAARPQI